MADFVFDLDQFWNDSRPTFLDLAKAKGPRRAPLESPAAVAWSVIARPTIKARCISGTVIGPRGVVSIVVRAPEAASPGVTDHADLLDVGNLRRRRSRRDGHGGRRR